MDWKECQDKKFVKDISVDRHLMQSLFESSRRKLNSSKRLELDQETASSVVSLAYDGLRELLEALAISRGYKVYNHDCFCAFLKEVVKESSLGNQFDRFRKIRNQINYYGMDISVSDAAMLRSDMEKLIAKIIKLL